MHGDIFGALMEIKTMTFAGEKIVAQYKQVVNPFSLSMLSKNHKLKN